MIENPRFPNVDIPDIQEVNLNDVFLQSKYGPNKDKLISSRKTTNMLQYVIEPNDDGSKLKIIFNIAGHNPENIEINSTKGSLKIISEPELKNLLTQTIDSKITVSQLYNPDTAKAFAHNGILTIELDKYEESTGKKIDIEY